MLDWIKEHPYLAGSLGVGLVVIIILMRRSSGGTAQAVSASNYDPTLAQAGLQAQTYLDANRIALAGQISGYNAAVNVAELNSAADVEKTRIAGYVALESIYASRDVALYDTSAGLAYGLASLKAAGIPAPVPVAADPGQQLVSGGNTAYIAPNSSAGQNVPNYSYQEPGRDYNGAVLQDCLSISSIAGQYACSQANTREMQRAEDAANAARNAPVTSMPVSSPDYGVPNPGYSPVIVTPSVSAAMASGFSTAASVAFSQTGMGSGAGTGRRS